MTATTIESAFLGLVIVCLLVVAAWKMSSNTTEFVLVLCGAILLCLLTIIGVVYI